RWPDACPVPLTASRRRPTTSTVRRVVLPSVDPLPPRAPGRLPWVGAGRRLLRSPTRFFVEMRQRLGDTFVVDAFGRRLFCVFSPVGVRTLYALREDEASFGQATYQ